MEAAAALADPVAPLAGILAARLRGHNPGSGGPAARERMRLPAGVIADRRSGLASRPGRVRPPGQALRRATPVRRRLGQFRVSYERYRAR